MTRTDESNKILPLLLIIDEHLADENPQASLDLVSSVSASDDNDHALTSEPTPLLRKSKRRRLDNRDLVVGPPGADSEQCLSCGNESCHEVPLTVSKEQPQNRDLESPGVQKGECYI